MRSFLKLYDFSRSFNVINERGILFLFLLFRLIMLGFFLGLSSGYFIGEYASLSVHTSILFVSVLLISALQAFVLNRTTHISTIGAFQLSIDIVLLTYVLSLTEDPFSFSYYLILIVCASLVTNATSSLLLAAFSGICYAVLISGVLFHDDRPLNQITTFDIFFSYATLVFAALLASIYASSRIKINNSIAEQNKKLQKSTAQQIKLMNSLAEGVITMDMNSAITGINDAAKAILGLKSLEPDKIMGKELTKAFSTIGNDNLQLLSKLNSSDSCELKINKNNNESAVFRCSSMDLNEEYGDESGRVLFLSDVSELKDMESRLEFHERMTRLFSELEEDKINENFNDDQLIGQSKSIIQIRSMITKLSNSDAPVLILGESGTGKEVVARSIHNSSLRSKMPFIPVNCGAIPEALIESELFGHKKGSFTGADHETLGLFREAEGGTLFLDEIGELPMHLQSKLLRVLQDSLVRPVGASKEVLVNVRIVAATNRSLKEEIGSGRFREDLYYRLRVVEIEVPPLRQRIDDIPLLIAHFLDREGMSNNDGSRVSPEALSLLLNYHYPGNIRELENILARGRVLGGGAILPENLPEEVRSGGGSNRSVQNHSSNDIDSQSTNVQVPVQLEELLENIERKYLNEAMSRTNGVKKDAARLLGLNFRSFRYRLKKYSID